MHPSRRLGRVPSVCVSDSLTELLKTKASLSVPILRSVRDRLAGPGGLSGSLFLTKESVRIERDERASSRDARVQTCKGLAEGTQGGGPYAEIGRASCRERVW